MGELVDGVWQRTPVVPVTGGSYVRQSSAFRHWVTREGSSGFKAEPGRYHLYASLGCPWAHRTLIFRKLKGLEHSIGLSLVEPVVAENGWTFGDGPDGPPDALTGARYLYELYARSDPHYSGRVSVPVLWDTQRQVIVSNESADILRMFNSAFADCARDPHDYYPEPLRAEIDAINARVYERINNGVYRAGFATRQDAYEEAFDLLFSALDELEARLLHQRYLVGGVLTEADWRLFTTLVRFDTVYYAHFKCNQRRLVDHPQLWNYARELYQVPGIQETVDFTHIKKLYYLSHVQLNPSRLIPKGPALDFLAPHDRERLPRS